MLPHPPTYSTHVNQLTLTHAGNLVQRAAWGGGKGALGRPPDGGREVRWPRWSGALIHLWGGNEVGVLPLRRVCVGLLVGKGSGSSRWWCDVCCGHGVSGCGRSGRCDQWVGGSESPGENDRVEFSLGCGVRSGAVGLGGGRPRFWVWSGLLFLMETQSL